MRRRALLKGILAGVMGSAAQGATARTERSNEQKERALLLQASPVAGFQYHDGEAVWPLMREGDPLELRREPGNRYDSRAVEVWWKHRKLGYVPRLDNSAVSQLLDRGEHLTARITRLRDCRDPWGRVKFEISWAGSRD